MQTLSVLLQAGTVAGQGAGFPLCSGKFAAGQSANPLCALGGDSGPAKRGLPALESLQVGGVQTLSVLLWAGTMAWQGAGFRLGSGKFAAGQSANPLCAPLGRDNGQARRRLPARLWKVCSGAECKLSLCSGQEQWLGKAQASRYGKFTVGQSANPLCAPPGRDSGQARRGLPTLLWKVSSRAE